MSRDIGVQRDSDAALLDALALQHSGELWRAIQIYRQLAVQLPRHARLLYLLGTAETELGNLSEGLALLETSIEIDPYNPCAYHGRGIVLTDLERLEEALQSYDRAIQLESDYAEAYFKRANVLVRLNRPDEALQSYDRAIQLKPDFVDAYYNRGLVLKDLDRLNEALQSYDRAIQFKPEDAALYNNRGVVLTALKRLDEALQSYDRAIQLKPDHVEAQINRGNVLKDLKRLDEALQTYDRAIQLKPNFAEAYYNRGGVLTELKRLEEALQSYERTIQLKPDHVEAEINRGNVLKDLKRLDEALQSYDRAIRLKPDFAEAYYNRGGVLTESKRLDEALQSYDRAIQLKPDHVVAHINQGNVLKDLKRLDEALQSYDRAIQLKPDFAEAYYNRGGVLTELKRLDEALQSYDYAIRLKPRNDFWLGDWFHAKLSACDWNNFLDAVNRIADDIGAEKTVISPFITLLVNGSPRLQQQSARIWLKAKLPSPSDDLPIQKYTGHERVRVGYFSADFHDHATMHLIVEMLERHDRSQFEPIGFSFGPDLNDLWRQRALRCFDNFYDVRARSDRGIAKLARTLEIDIAIDLKGYTRDSRPGIFSERCAPIQVNYLGYPGTMGASFMDYIVADRTVIPEEDRQYYTEKVAYLPNCYQANCRELESSGGSLSRAELGLGDGGFVFCCFNNNNKITPSVFENWMRILGRVEESVLWLLESNPSASAHLRGEARRMGVNPDRLVFAKIRRNQEHLNRLRHADLFLDTLPCNAHTTASDALRMGVPLLTQIGTAFAGRVGSSLLKTLDLHELITYSAQEYEDLAVALAKNPVRLSEIRRQLGDHFKTSPLYDPQLFARHLEDVYRAMQSRYSKGLVPDHIEVTRTI